MPSTPDSFRSRHNKKLSDVMAEHAASQANAILRKTGNEAMAIRIANANAHHGGGLERMLKAHAASHAARHGKPRG